MGVLCGIMWRIFSIIFMISAALAIGVPYARADDTWAWHRSMLVVNPEMRMNQYDDASERTKHDLAFVLNVGLDWPGFRFVSLQALGGVGFVCGFEEAFSYRHHNQKVFSRFLGIVSLKGIAELHTPDRLISLLAAIHGQMAFDNRRGGIFTLEAGTGVSVRPFDARNALLRSVAFRGMVWFRLTDDFEKVFDLQRQLVNPGIEVMLEF